jgi:hypothetical protein
MEFALYYSSRTPLADESFGRHGILTHYSSSLPFPGLIQWTICKRRRKTSVYVNSNSQLIAMDFAQIKVVGMGGGGNNVVNRMIRGGLQVFFFSQTT